MSSPFPAGAPCAVQSRCPTLPGSPSHRWNRSGRRLPCPAPPPPDPAGHKAPGRLQKEVFPRTDPPPAPPGGPPCFPPSGLARQRPPRPTHPVRFSPPRKRPGSPPLSPHHAGSGRAAGYPDKTRSPGGCPRRPDQRPVLPPRSVRRRNCHNGKFPPPPPGSASGFVCRPHPEHRADRSGANP